MPIARFEMPDGRIARFEVPEGTTPEQAQAMIAEAMPAQAATEAQEEPGMLERVGNLFTGSDRETRATEELPELPNSGLLAGLDLPMVQKEQIAAAIALTTDPAEIAQILKAAAPDVIGVQADEAGNILVANNKTGARAVVNKPGVSAMDAINLGAMGAAFTPAGRTVKGAGLAKSAGVMGARAAGTQAGIEGLQASAGGDVDPGEIALAGAFGAGAPVVAEGVGRAVGGARRLIGGADEAVPVVPPTVTPEQAQRQAVTSVGQAATETGKKRVPVMEKLAQEVQPDETILEAAERLGMREQLIPSQYSRSQGYREIEQALASIPGSTLNEQQKQAATTLAAKADEFIQQFGGDVDKAAFSEQFKDQALSTIGGLEKQADQLYASMRESIPQKTSVIPRNTLDYLANEAAEMGGEKFLPPRLRRMARDLGENPTYGRIDFLRKEVGQGLRGSGTFKDAEQGQLKQLYSRLLDDQAAVAQELGMGDTFSAARSLVAQRKALEEDTAKLLGKDLSGAVTSKLGGAVRNLSKGDYKNFDQVMERIPEEMRRTAVITSLNDAFTGGSRMEKQLSAPGFVDWYNGLQRNQAAKERIEKYLTPEGRQSLQDIYQVARGMREANKEKITTGRLNSIKLLEEFDQPGGMLSKIYDIGRNAAAAEGVTSTVGLPGVGAASVIASKLSKQRTPVTKAADELLASQAFKDAVAKIVETNGNMMPKAAAAEKALQRTPEYRKWLAEISPAARKTVSNTGFLLWLSGPPREETIREIETQQSR